MGVRYEGVTYSRSAVPRVSRDKRDKRGHVEEMPTLVTRRHTETETQQSERAWVSISNEGYQPPAPLCLDTH